MGILKYLSYVGKISIIGTIRANFRLLPRRQALRFPILVFKGTTIRIGKEASVTIDVPLRTGLVWIGALDMNWIPKGVRNYISLQGSVKIYGTARFSYRSHIVVSKGAELILGGYNAINHDTKILVVNRVVLDCGARIGWNTQICDSVFHYVEANGVVTRKTNPVRIGREAWVCSYCNVGRGAVLPDYSVLASCSLLNKDYSLSGTNLLLAGIPAKIVKTGVRRIMEFVEPELCGRIDSYFDKNPSANTLDITDLGYENR